MTVNNLIVFVRGARVVWNVWLMHAAVDSYFGVFITITLFN